MKFEKLFGSKTKSDILKYLVFRRQGISMRAFEHELQRSFPAIKKQIDLLEEAGVVTIDKQDAKRAVYLCKWLDTHIKNLFIAALKDELRTYFLEHEFMVEKHFFGKVFGNAVEMDLVLIHSANAAEFIDKLKEDINLIFRGYLIELVSVVFMTTGDFEKRYRLADKFVLWLMRNAKEE